MNYRLGLDLGTNSLGWSVFSLDEKNHVAELVDMGVRIFSDGRNPKTHEPLAAARRTARGIRRQLYRKKQRRRIVFKTLQKEGLIPLDMEEARKLKSLNPYELRVKALDNELTKEELGRCLFNLSVHRGFKSNRKDADRTEEEKPLPEDPSKMTQKDKCVNLTNAIKQSGYRTLGEFLWKTRIVDGEDKGIRFAAGRKPYYPTRQLYTEEFDTIKKAQIKYYPDLDWDLIYDKLFFQRPLRKQQRGKCLYDNTKDRTFKALPSSQMFRILQDIADLKYKNADNKFMSLDDAQCHKVFDLLNTKEKVTFDALRKALALDAESDFNLETQARTELKGNSAYVKMHNAKLFGDLWNELSLKEQDDIVELLITADEDEEVYKALERYDLTDEQKKRIVNAVLPSGTTMFCKEVTEALVEKMQLTFMRYDEAVKALGYKYSDQSVEKCDILPYYGKVLQGSVVGGDLSKDEKTPELKYGKISNPTVHIALNQLRVIVNALIKKYGKPQQIVVELSRDLKATREAKERIQKQIALNQKKNAELNIKIRDAYKIAYPNRDDRLKVKLWEELDSGSLGHRCIYCGKPINGSELFTSSIQIEHILPYSRTLCDSESNKTLAHQSCNHFKGERTPFEAFGNNPPGYNWAEILERAEGLANKDKRKNFMPEAIETFEKDSNFINSQLTDNAYLSRIAIKYLRAVCDDVWAVKGGMTKLLRDRWNIDSILKKKITEEEIAALELKDEEVGKFKKNRYDHRHHALDAVVIALTDRSLVKEISTCNARGMKNRIEVPPLPVTYEELVQKTHSVVVSFKPDHGAQGKLSKETLLGKVKSIGEIDIKSLKAEDIDRLVSQRVKKEVAALYAEKQDLKKVVQELKDVYPKLKVYDTSFVTRVPLTSLKEKDIASIVDPKLRSALAEYWEHNKFHKFEDVVNDFMKTKWNGNTHACKARCLNTVQTPIEIRNADGTERYYAPNDYFAVIVWQIPVKDGFKYEGQFIRRDEVDSKGSIKKEVLENKPHPAAKNKGIVHKDDCLEFTYEGKNYLCRIAGFSATRNQIDYRPIYAAEDCYTWLTSTSERMTEPCWKPQKKDNFVSINVLFGERQARLVTVSPLGDVFKKQ